MTRIAIIGGGISGLACAWMLGDRLTRIYDPEEKLGGHAHTCALSHHGTTLAVDTAFMVYNHRNYPHFCRLLSALGLRGQATDMSFSVVHEGFDVEYNGGSLGGLIADRRNIFRRDFRHLLADILRFNRLARRDVNANRWPDDHTVGDYITTMGLGRFFTDAYLLPMGASIWSCTRAEFLSAPARFALSFFHNHGLLNLFNRPQWRHLTGGSCCYVDALTAQLPPHAWRGGGAVTSVRVVDKKIIVRAAAQEETYDAVIFALHAPDALAVIDSPTVAEQEILSAFRYTQTQAVMHTDTTILPARRRAWAAWNYRIFAGDNDLNAAATYNLSMLQHLATPADQPLLLTLNAGIAHVAEDRIIDRFCYAHPLPDINAMRAKARLTEINGARGLFFCGAYWGNGFHEDGAASGVAAAHAVMEFLS